MERDELREAAFEKMRKERGGLGAFDEPYPCPYDHKAMWLNGYDAALEHAKQPQWTACDEKLPENGSAGLFVTMDDSLTEPAYFIDGIWYSADNDKEIKPGNWFGNVIAWCKLPEPYNPNNKEAGDAE